MLAAKRATSLSALLTQAIEEIVAQSDLYEIAKKRQLFLMEHGLELNINETPDWTQDELHER